MGNGLAVIDQRSGELRRADDWDERRVEFVRRNFCGGAPDAEASAFIEICKRRGLSPEEKHAHLTKRGHSWVMQTGIDGYRLIADRTGAYAGSDDPAYDREDAAHPDKATVTVWKLVAGQRVPFTASARWAEYKPQGSQAFMWDKMPYLMLAKCAEALALRKAFPAELAAIYTDAEMDQAGDDEPRPPRRTAQPARPQPPAIPPRAQAAPARREARPEVVDPETGEIVDAEVRPVARGNGNGNRFAGLHKAIRDASLRDGSGIPGDDVHRIAHDLAEAAYGVGSLNDLDGQQVYVLWTLVNGLDAAGLEAEWQQAKEVVAERAAGSGDADDAGGELPGMPRPPADRWTS